MADDRLRDALAALREIVIDVCLNDGPDDTVYDYADRIVERFAALAPAQPAPTGLREAAIAALIAQAHDKVRAPILLDAEYRRMARFISDRMPRASAPTALRDVNGKPVSVPDSRDFGQWSAARQRELVAVCVALHEAGVACVPESQGDCIPEFHEREALDLIAWLREAHFEVVEDD